MNRFSHILEPNKSSRFPNRFICFDCETRVEKSRLDGERNVLWFGVAQFFDIPNNSKKKAHFDECVFSSADELICFIESHTEPKTRTIVSAHNLGFDFIIAGLIRTLRAHKWQVEFPIASRMRFITKARKGNVTLLFLDTMNYCPTTLRELAKSLYLNKLEMPKPDAPMEQWISYCRRDTEIVVAFWRYLYDFIKTNDLGTFAPTAAGLAFKAYRHKFMKHSIYIHNTYQALELERETYTGGRCEPFRIGLCPEQSYYLLDVNALYPSVMHRNLFPTKLLRYRQYLALDTLRHELDSHFVIARVAIDTPENNYPLRREGKLIFPVGRFVTTLAAPELQLALNRGHIRHILAMSVYDQAELFTRFVESFYQMRQQFKRKGQLAFALFAKIVMNALYGKFGQKGHRRETLVPNAALDFGYEYLFDSVKQKEYHIYYWDGKGIVESEEGESFNSFPAIAAAVTSYGRIRLLELMEKAGKDNVFYVDTDSLIVNEQGFNNLAGEIVEGELGKLKIESKSNSLSIYAPKDYEFGDEVITKGVSVNDIYLAGNLVEQVRFSTFLESLRLGETEAIVTQKVQKFLSRRYDKATVHPDGTVEPFSLSDF